MYVHCASQGDEEEGGKGKERKEKRTKERKTRRKQKGTRRNQTGKRREEREKQEGEEDQRRIKVIAQVRKESSFSFLVSEVERSISVISVMLNVRGLFARPVVGVEPVGGDGAGGREFGSRE